MAKRAQTEEKRDRLQEELKLRFYQRPQDEKNIIMKSAEPGEKRDISADFSGVQLAQKR